MSSNVPGTLWKKVSSQFGAPPQWVPVGTITAVGPKGDKGDRGDRGAPGPSVAPTATFPPGFCAPFAGTVIPTGWLQTDGTAVSRTGQRDLFLAIGTTYGAGDGTTTFNLPDIRDRVPIGVSPGGISGRAITRLLGVAGGEETHAVTINEIPSHQHGYTAPNNAGVMGYTVGSTVALFNSLVTNTDPIGGSVPMSLMQPFVVMYWVIKT